jgi:TonB family protein
MQAVMRSPDEREPLGKAFFGSIAAHGGVVAAILLIGYFHLTDNWGSPHASSGSVGVTMVPTIPIARHEGPINPLANQTKNIVPQKPEPVKAKPVEKAPDLKAIPIPDREKPKKVQPTKLKPMAPQTFVKPQAYQPNQVYSKTAQAMNSPLYGLQGAGGIDIGPASVLGDRCGAYVDEIRRQISQHWNQSGVTASSSQKTGISFTLLRSGLISNVQVASPSGSYLLDNSAKHAVVDTNQLPSVPPQCPGSEIPVTLWFQIKQ